MEISASHIRHSCSYQFAHRNTWTQIDQKRLSMLVRMRQRCKRCRRSAAEMSLGDEPAKLVLMQNAERLLERKKEETRETLDTIQGRVTEVERRSRCTYCPAIDDCCCSNSNGILSVHPFLRLPVLQYT